MAWICRVFDTLRGPRIFEFFWRLFIRDRPLSAAELEAGTTVLGASAIDYGAVQIADGGILWPIFRLNRNRAFVTFHTVNMPPSRASSSSYLGVVVHELVHVYQFELIGSIYIWQALQAQRSAEGYNYGGWRQLVKDREEGKRFRDYNREQQGRIPQHFYDKVLAKGMSAASSIYRAYQPFINDLRKGQL